MDAPYKALTIPGSATRRWRHSRGADRARLNADSGPALTYSSER